MESDEGEREWGEGCRRAVDAEPPSPAGRKASVDAPVSVFMLVLESDCSFLKRITVQPSYRRGPASCKLLLILFLFVISQ